MRGAALATVLIFSSVSGLAHADGAGARVADVPKLRAQLASARVRRNLGWGLSFAGILLIGVGSVLIGYSATTDFNPDGKLTYEQTLDIAVRYGVAGAATSLIGLLVGIPGAVLALRNQSTMTDVEWRIGAARATVFVAPSATGAMAGASFRF